LELATAATNEAIARSELSPEDVDEVVYGNVSRPVAYHNLAREIVLTLSLPARIPAFTVGMACASACVAISSAAGHLAGSSPGGERDRWAHRSRALGATARDDGGRASEVCAFYRNGTAVTQDGHIGRDTTLEKLATLPPVFDRAHGTITAGNASPLTDGA